MGLCFQRLSVAEVVCCHQLLCCWCAACCAVPPAGSQTAVKHCLAKLHLVGETPLLAQVVQWAGLLIGQRR